jgi:cysteine sulfinate desulfinase/cysteine desulfurase-like protein
VIDSSFRISLSRDTTDEEIDALVDGIMNVLRWKNHR